MKKLWVRISLAMGLFVLLVSFMILGVVTWDIFEAWFAGRRGQPQALIQPRDLPQTVVSAVILIGVVSIVAGIYISRILTAPLEQLADGVKQIGSRQYSTRLELKGSDEIVAVATAFNDMAGELQQAETLRRHLMADVAHELRTPLTVLEGNLRATIDDVFMLDKAEMANMYGQVQHLIRLVTDLHELAQAEAKQLHLHKIETDTRGLLTEIEAIFQPIADENRVVLHLEMPDSIPHSTLDPHRIRQVLHNLISNALRHTPANGEIKIVLQQTGNRVMIQIIDSGDGIEPSQLPYLFNRFYRADSSRTRKTGGSGLGLAICKALVEAHDGKIWVESDGIGQGSVFAFSLEIG